MRTKTIKEPNHVCWVCGTEYWACDLCDARASWRSICCSRECYEKYMSSIETQSPTMPQRLDKTEDEVREIMAKEPEELKASAIEDLADYADELESGGISEASDAVNQDILDAKKKNKKK